MVSKRHPRKSEHGVSYVELLVVIVIISIVAGLALMSWGKSREHLRLQNAANGLKIAFERSRFDSVRRRPENLDFFSRVVISGSSSSADQYTLRTWVDQGGTSTSTDSTISTTPDGVRIVPYPGLDITFPVTVAFNMRGETYAVQANGTPVFPAFNVCYGGCTPSESMIVVVTLTGTVQILPGTSSIPSFATPGTTDPGATADVNEMVTFPGPGADPFPTATPIDGGPGGTPTPDPNGTPSGTPTPDPSVTPSGTPTPDPSVTPSATPTATPSVTPSATPTATPPPPCTSSASANVSGGWKGKSPVKITVNYQNATATVFTITKDDNPPRFTISPTTVTVTGTGSFQVSVTFANGNQGIVHITVAGSGCGSTTITGDAT